MIRILKVTAICMKLLLAADSNQRTVIRAGDGDDDNDDDGQTMVRAPIDDKKHKKMYKKIQIDNDDENATMVQTPAGKQTEDIDSIIESGMSLKNLQVGNEHIELMKLRSSDVYQHTEEYPGDECYCVISEKHLELFPGLERTYLDAGRKEAAVVKLERLFGNVNPRKWLDWVICYSGGEKMQPIRKEEFIGTAIYAQRYIKANTEGEKTLIDNMFNLFVKGAILDKKIDSRSTFYSDIYADSNDNEKALFLLEDFMKTVVKKVLADLGVEFSIDGENLNIYQTDKDCDINNYCNKKNELKVNNRDSTAFKNVIMKRLPAIKSKDYRYILLTLIGMIRTGKNIISAKCEAWMPRNQIKKNYLKKDCDLRDVISLVNTNRNLVGIAEFINSADMDNVNELLGDVKEQLRYFEFQLGGGDSKVAKMAELIKGLSDVELKVAVYDPLPAIRRWLLKIPHFSNIKNLSIKILDASYYQDTLKDILESENVKRLELFCYDMTLEKFLLSIYRPLMTGEGNLRSKLKMVAVTNLGNLSSEVISDELLGDLGLERLIVSIDRKKDIDLSNLVRRGIITRNGFRYLVIGHVNEKNIQCVVNLKRLMGGKREWPVLFTDYQQIWTFECAKTSSFHEVVDPETQ